MDKPPPPPTAPDLFDLPAPRATSAAEGLPRRRFTVAEVEAMVDAGLMLEDERVELIGGELVPMSPKGSRHEMVKTALLERWYLTGSSVLLVVEIADSSLRFDIGRKAVLYASFGIRELWVIDAAQLTTRVFRQPSADGFRLRRDASAADTVVPLIAPDVFHLRLADFDIE